MKPNRSANMSLRKSLKSHVDGQMQFFCSENENCLNAPLFGVSTFFRKKFSE